MSWTVHLEGGPRRVNHAAVTVGDKIYSFGGYCTGEDYRNRRPMDIHVLNTDNYCWTKLPSPSDPCHHQYSLIPYQRYGHTAVAHNKLVYIWGGRNDEASCNILFCFNTGTLQWSKPKASGNIPAARDGHSACIINDCMYIFGGYEEDMDQFSQEVYVLNLNTMTWRYEHTRGTPPSYRDFHSATAIGDCMYIFGGRGDRHGPYHSQEEEYCNKVLYLDTKTSTWHQPTVTGFVPRGRRSHSAFSYKGDLYFFGGFNGIYNHHFDDLLKFNPRSCEWTVVKPKGKGPCARRRQSCCVVGNRVFLFGGTSPHTNSALQHTDYHQQHHFPPQEARLMDHNDLHVLDFAPTLRTLCILVVVQMKLDLDQLPDTIRWDIRAMTTPKNILKPLDNAG